MGKQTETHRITHLLSQVAEGHEGARDDLIGAVYQQLAQDRSAAYGRRRTEPHLAGNRTGS